MSKYHSRKCPCGSGHIHPSIKEAARCNELHLMQRAGEITGLEVQKKYELIPAVKYDNMPNERKCEYTADFVYRKAGEIIVEDTKGYRTKDYIIKRKLFKIQYCRKGGMIFREV